MPEDARLVHVGTADPSGTPTPIKADVKVLGSDVAVTVTLTKDYQQICPPGFPFRPGQTGADKADLSYPRTLTNGLTIELLACEANALVSAGAATFA